MFALFAVGQATFIAGLLTPLGLLTSASFISGMSLLVQAGVCGWAALGFYGQSASPVLLVLVAFVLSQLIFWALGTVALILALVFAV